MKKLLTIASLILAAPLVRNSTKELVAKVIYDPILYSEPLSQINL